MDKETKKEIDKIKTAVLVLSNLIENCNEDWLNINEDIEKILK